MTKHMRALCASTFLALALAGTACAAAGQGEQTEKIEPAPISEGVDTSCEVSFARYTGSYKDLFLNQGDRIAVISPSALPTQAQVDATVAGLESWGYEPVLGKHVCEETRSLQDCVDDLAWALSDPDIKAIFCVRGGYGASEVTDALDSHMVARQIVDDVDVPVAFGFPAGHGDTNYPLLMGATAHLSVSNDSFTLGWS